MSFTSSCTPAQPRHGIEWWASQHTQRYTYRRGFEMINLTQRKGCGPICLRIERDSVGRNALVQIEQRIHSKHHHTTCKRFKCDQHSLNPNSYPTEHWHASSELTDGFGDSHDLCTIKGQITERPDDRMNLLHDVEGDCNNAASVLTDSHTPGEKKHIGEVTILIKVAA